MIWFIIWCVLMCTFPVITILATLAYLAFLAFMVFLAIAEKQS